MIPVGQEPPPMFSTDEVASKSRKPSKAKEPGKARFAVLNAFVDFTLQTLDHASRSVWLVLYRDTRPDGLARTAQADIARRIGMSVSTVKRAIHMLESRGLVTVKYRGGLGGRLSVYRVHALPMQGSKL
jgi:hypothetical protein